MVEEKKKIALELKSKLDNRIVDLRLSIDKRKKICKEVRNSIIIIIIYT